MEIVRKCHRRTDEHFVSNGGTAVDVDAILDLASLADHHPIVDVAILANRNTCTYFG
jgi:hypothetical protein